MARVYGTIIGVMSLGCASICVDVLWMAFTAVMHSKSTAHIPRVPQKWEAKRNSHAQYSRSRAAQVILYQRAAMTIKQWLLVPRRNRLPQSCFRFLLKFQG